MAKKVLSIVIGTECTKVCELSYRKNYKNKGIRVYRSISFPTPENSIEDGYIKDMNRFGEELRNQMKAAKLKSDKVIFSLNSSKIANREIILPPMREKKIMDTIQTGASEYFPIDIKDYILSYYILEKNTSKRKERRLKKQHSKEEQRINKKLAKIDKKLNKKKSKTEIIADRMELTDTTLSQPSDGYAAADNKAETGVEGKKHIRIGVYAVPSTLVKNYYNFAKAMHLDIVSLDYSGNSSYQMIRRQVNRGTNIFIQLNEQDTLISILRDDTLILQRTVSYGISMLVDSVMEHNVFKVSNKEEALELLENKNLLSIENDSKESVHLLQQFDEESAAASELLKATEESQRRREEQLEKEIKRNIAESLHYLTNSIARMIDYYKANHKNVDIHTIYLSGTGVRIQGIDEFFYREIGMSNKKMEKLWTVSSKKKAARYRKNPSEFISCIGAVLQPIDFVPKEFIEKKQKRSAIFATAIFALACIAGSIGTVYVSYTDYLAAKEELDEINDQIASMPQISSVFQELDLKEEQLSNLLEMEEQTHNNNDNIKNVIEALEKNLPSGTVINTMEFGDTKVFMSVTVIDQGNYGPNAIVAKLLTQLQTIEYFSKVDTSSTSITEEDFITKINFSITCTYKE